MFIGLTERQELNMICTNWESASVADASTGTARDA